MLKDILSIGGHSGLFKLVAQAQKGIIVESISDKKRFPVYHTAKISALEDIAIYTQDEEVPLYEVFKKIYKIENKSATSFDKNSSSADIKEYFEDILPDYDKDRVYVSDMKKVLVWYNLLQQNGVMDECIKAEQEAKQTQTDNSNNE